MVSGETIQQACERLVEEFHPQQIILFGSQARGTADDRSDVDLLVISPLRERRFDMLLKMDRALKGFRTAFDIVLLTPEEFEIDRQIPGTVARPAAKEGRVLYVSPA
jgi:uncharacterized protein